MNHQNILTKQNIFVFLLVLFCLLEAVQMVDFSQPLLPSFQYNPMNKFDVMRRDFFCAKTKLMENNAKEIYFLADKTLAERDLLFESFYFSYILAPEILITSDTNNPFAITVIESENTKKFLTQYPYQIIQQCGNTRVLVLKKIEK